MTIEQDFLQYIDHNGLIAPKIGGSSLNGILYTVVSMIVMKDNDSLSQQTKEALTSAIAYCQVKLGLFNRVPGTQQYLESPDDYVGIGATGLLGCWFPKFVLDYGFKNRFNYNNEQPDKWTFQTFFGRQGQLVAHWFFGSKKNPILPLRLWWSLAVTYSAFKMKVNDQPGWQDGFILTWLLVRTFEESGINSLLCSLASKYWRKKLYQTYKNGIKDLPYLENNTYHPICKYWIK